MRLILCITSLFLVALSPAMADQRDPRLNVLFEDLRAGEGDPDAVMTDIEQVWVQPPETGIAILLDRSISALEERDADVAHILIDHVTELAPSFAEGWVIRGHIHLLEDDLLAAREAFKKAVELEPRHYQALEVLGDLAVEVGDKEIAHTYYRQALDWNPHLPGVREKADRLRQELGGQEI